jgi:hypothetical protein
MAEKLYTEALLAATDDSLLTVGTSQTLRPILRPPSKHLQESPAKRAHLRNPSQKSYDLSVDTEIDFPCEKPVSKVPLELVVHPKARRWVFQTSKEHKSVNRQLKIRYKKNKSSPEKPFDSYQLSKEQSPSMSKFFQKTAERSEYNNDNIIQQILLSSPSGLNTEEKWTPKYKKMHAKSTSNKFRPQPPDYFNETTEVPFFFPPKAKDRQNSLPFSPTAPQILNKLSTGPTKSPLQQRAFFGRLEPSIEIEEKYVMQSPQVEITCKDGVEFRKTLGKFGKTSSTPFKPKLMIKMNKITLAQPMKTSHTDRIPERDYRSTKNTFFGSTKGFKSNNISKDENSHSNMTGLNQGQYFPTPKEIGLLGKTNTGVSYQKMKPGFKASGLFSDIDKLFHNMMLKSPSQKIKVSHDY